MVNYGSLMPDGKTHDAITLVGAIAAVPATLLLAPPAWRTDYAAVAILVGATLFSGWMLSPDLDLDSSIYHRWGPLRFLWWPYQKLIPHRSFLSHSYLLGPLLRVTYFVALTFLLLRVGTYFVHFLFPVDRNTLTREYATFLWDLPCRYPHLFYAAVIGTLFGTALHVAADTLVTGFKHVLHGRRRKHRH